MNSSTISKVEFFRYVITLTHKGKLHTAGRNLPARIDRLLESRSSRIAAFLSAVLGIITIFYQVYLWFTD